MKIIERFVAAGVEVKTRNRKEVENLFTKLGGKVLSVSDKTVELEFPSASAAREFMTYAKQNGAMFEDEDGRNL